MTSGTNAQFLLFEDHRCLIEGPPGELVATLLYRFADDRRGTLLVFDASTGMQVDLDLSLNQQAITQRLADLGASQSGTDDSSAATDATPLRRGPGRPKLGVVSREVTLLPRHWAWLSAQPGGASVSLRKLVDQARKSSTAKDRLRQAQEHAYCFINTLAGNLNGFEEACRALYSADPQGFAAHTADWPADVRKHALRLANDAFEVTT